MKRFCSFLLPLLVCSGVPQYAVGQDDVTENGVLVEGGVAVDKANETSMANEEPPPQPKSEAEKDQGLRTLVAQATKARDNGEYERALRLLDRVLAEPGVQRSVMNDALYARAWTYIFTYRYVEATSDIERVIALDPEVNKYYYARGVIARDTGHPDEALRCFATACEKAYHARSLQYTIEIKIQQGDYEGALKDCESTPIRPTPRSPSSASLNSRGRHGNSKPRVDPGGAATGCSSRAAPR